MEEKEKITYEEPQKLTPNNVVYYSNTYKQLRALNAEGKWKTYAIMLKAKRFLKEGCIDYSKEKKCYLCKPIPHYNQTTYELRPIENHQFSCTCQFYNRVVIKQKIPGLCCSHVLALKLMLKIWNYNKRKDKEKYPENYQ